MGIFDFIKSSALPSSFLFLFIINVPSTWSNSIVPLRNRILISGPSASWQRNILAFPWSGLFFFLVLLLAQHVLADSDSEDSVITVVSKPVRLVTTTIVV
jgi:hypothetical protein